jgi:23S rRNA pseudouridine2605 synthase
MEERLQKYISQAGIASRRHAEELILAGKVRVNGEIVRTLGTKVNPEKDQVQVGGRKIKQEKLVYLVLNKPKRYLTTRDDPKRRRTVYDLIPAELKNVVWPVGRLDFHTEGLLILTNDGELTQTMTHPSREHDKEYEVKIDKELSDGRIKKLETGIILDDRKTSPARVRTQGTTIYLTIHEGWNRQIRKMFAVLGHTVRNLKRIRIGKYKLGDLPVGQHKFVSKKDLL